MFFFLQGEEQGGDTGFDSPSPPPHRRDDCASCRLFRQSYAALETAIERMEMLAAELSTDERKREAWAEIATSRLVIGEVLRSLRSLSG
jgi:hypothetical protein